MRSTALSNVPAVISIGELSRRAGVNIETIRYYERINMMPHPPRTASGRRVYGQVESRTLAFIRRARDLPSTKSAPCWPWLPRADIRHVSKSETSPRAISQMCGQRSPISKLWRVCLPMRWIGATRANRQIAH